VNKPETKRERGGDKNTERKTHRFRESKRKKERKREAETETEKGDKNCVIITDKLSILDKCSTLRFSK
jgi:hypothetical protein